MSMEDKIKDALKERPKTNQQLRFELEVKAGDDRLLDRALQQLRRDGHIKILDRRRWVLTDVEVCPSCNGKGWVKK